jgi:excisionase family DNA binding protein
MMIETLKPALELARHLPPESLPEFLGALRECEVVALARLTTPAPQQTAPDILLSVEEAAERLGVSTTYLYRNHSRFTFTRRMGRSLRFSAQGIDQHIRRSGTLTPRLRTAIMTPVR